MSARTCWLAGYPYCWWYAHTSIGCPPTRCVCGGTVTDSHETRVRQGDLHLLHASRIPRDGRRHVAQDRVSLEGSVVPGDALGQLRHAHPDGDGRRGLGAVVRRELPRSKGPAGCDPFAGRIERILDRGVRVPVIGIRHPIAANGIDAVVRIGEDGRTERRWSGLRSLDAVVGVGVIVSVGTDDRVAVAVGVGDCLAVVSAGCAGAHADTSRAITASAAGVVLIVGEL